ncbi:hypothetical protein [Clostridium sporogenes]|uniref:hypothetical protein n=1 Tax=Clostridium TaxID=1485 RepID=UPI00090B5A0F|nr:hypothetical protein [Clostridium sporogenes]APF25263.1 hypothetical protein NPD7_4064 [Clostridium sporogenes]
MRKVFFNDLPRKEGIGALKGKQVIDWKNSTGYKIKFVYDDVKGELKIIEYNTENRKLYVKYLSNETIYDISVCNLHKCKICKILKKRTGEFKVKILTKFKDNNRNITIINKKYEIDKKNIKRKYYKYKCNICGYDEGWIEESNLLKGIGCACCFPNPKVAVLGINTIWDTDRWMCNLGVSEEDAKKYTSRSGQKIYPKCPYCSRVRSKAISISYIYKNHSIGCSCGDGISYPEKFMFNVLEQLNIDFEYQFAPKWCKYIINNKSKKGKYDFYFEVDEKKYIVEMDGNFHYKNNEMNGQTSQESQYIDYKKDRLAYEHGIEVIRIDSQESELNYIKNNILSSKLNDTLKLNELDWNKVEEFSLNNLVKEACNLKRNNPEMFSTEISQIIKLNYVTVIRYLKKGTKLNWCKYSAEEEMRRTSINNAIRNKKRYSKPVEIFKDNISLGTFYSCNELERQSEEKFGIKLLNQNISKACRNGKTYKGCIFKYI